MNPFAPHFLSCHVPLVGGLFALALLGVALRRGETLLHEVANYAVIAVAVGTAIAWASGPASLTALENWIDPAGRAHADRHSGLGDIVMVIWGLAAFVALWGVILGRAGQSPPRWRAPVLVALVILGLGFAAWAGHEGGRIRHPELRDSTRAPVPTGIDETTSP